MKIPHFMLALLVSLSLLGPALSASSSASEFKASMDKMHKAMAMPMTGMADHDFAMMMVPHHQGAIDMAHVELKYGTDPKLRKMAEQIVKDQQKEIQELKGWLKSHPMKMTH